MGRRDSWGYDDEDDSSNKAQQQEPAGTSSAAQAQGRTKSVRILEPGENAGSSSPSFLQKVSSSPPQGGILSKASSKQQERDASLPSSSDSQTNAAQRSSSTKKRLQFAGVDEEVGLPQPGQQEQQQPQQVEPKVQPQQAEQQQEEDDDEDYDPYHGIGKGPIMQYPLEVVFRLMDSTAMEQSEQRLKWSKGYAIILRLSVAVLMVSCFAMFCLHLHNRPQQPIVSVLQMNFERAMIKSVKKSVIVAQQAEGLGNYYAYVVNMAIIYVLNITNPNHHVDFSVDFIELSIMYRGYELGYDRVESFEIRRRSNRYPFLFIQVISVKLPLRVGYTMKPDIDSNDITVEADFLARMSFSVSPGLRGIAFVLRYRCIIHFTQNGTQQSCEYHQSDVKGYPSHYGLRFWRQPGWPSFVRDWLKLLPNVPYTPQYYDARYNYFFDPSYGGPDFINSTVDYYARYGPAYGYPG